MNWQSDYDIWLADSFIYDYHHGILNRMFSQETITDVHLYLDCLNFIINWCLVGNSNEAYLSTLKVLRSNCLFVDFKPQTNTADKGVLPL